MKGEKKITPAEVEHLARLARLALTAEEKEKFRGQLDKILRYMEKLDELDVSGLDPLTHPLPLHNVFRKDEAVPGLKREVVLNNAPEQKDGFFKVPPVLE
ncbi:MAG: Asp-tRNA(Asn)/Glu-tRNA(Gln) amidotransferase subunit GatC [Candidatus Aureabacteria bacterium]|nr:Asp-tRNA(Asn)/Glu-tRNA(Gln) amidotransferase subunit GatC [Candidatus Auribacterota bacterium]